MKAPGPRSLRALFARMLGDSRGVSAIEFAVVGPIVFILILGTLELALDMFVDASVQLAAQAASRVGLTTVDPSSGTRADQAKTIVMAYLGRWKSVGATVTIATLNYGTYGNVGTKSYTNDLGTYGNVVSYNITVTMPGFSGIPRLFGVSTLTFQRNYLVQNEK
ncbi:MAG: pilus assembly protein [Pseudomonadota bacterium]|jgi:Flp pilus assembly protein TadG|nr:pilus assembly protein [Pseudomonadota bacterium]